MSKPYRLIKNGVIVNTIIANEVESIAHLYDSIEEVVDSPPVQAVQTEVQNSTIVPTVDFMLRFTTAERVSFRDATKTNGVLLDFLQYLQDPRVTFINTESSLIAEGMSELVHQGIITETRMNTIVS